MRCSFPQILQKIFMKLLLVLELDLFSRLKKSKYSALSIISVLYAVFTGLKLHVG